LFGVHDGDPPFVGDDVEALTVSEQMFGLQGSLYKFPPQIRNPQFGDFPDSFERSERMEGWKIGRAEQAEDHDPAITRNCSG
jgi:hypothetical protein